MGSTPRASSRAISRCLSIWELAVRRSRRRPDRGPGGPISAWCASRTAVRRILHISPAPRGGNVYWYLKIGEILFPFFSSLQRELSDRIADLLFRSRGVPNLLAATLVPGALIPVAGPLLNAWTWKGSRYPDPGVAVVLAVAGMLGRASNVFAYYLLANGRSRSNAVIALVTAVDECSLRALSRRRTLDGRRRAGAPVSALSRRSSLRWSCYGKASAWRACGLGWLTLYCSRWQRA